MNRLTALYIKLAEDGDGYENFKNIAKGALGGAVASRLGVKLLQKIPFSRNFLEKDVSNMTDEALTLFLLTTPGALAGATGGYLGSDSDSALRNAAIGGFAGAIGGSTYMLGRASREMLGGAIGGLSGRKDHDPSIGGALLGAGVGALPGLWYKSRGYDIPNPLIAAMALGGASLNFLGRKPKKQIEENV
jgi:hypothetical protein